jgi:hypothetical protein
VVVVGAEPVERAEKALVVDVVRLRLRLSLNPSRVVVDAVVALAAKLTADAGK